MNLHVCEVQFLYDVFQWLCVYVIQFHLSTSYSKYARQSSTTVLAINNSNIYDGAALFGKEHKNLLASGTGVTQEAMQTMIMALANQKDQFGESIIINPATIVVPSGMKFDMPKVGASVLVVHLSNGSAMGIVAGTYWNSSHRPPISGKGVYRKDLAQAIGEAFLQYSGSSLQIHAPAITLDASRITLATKSGSITVAEIINHIKG